MNARPSLLSLFTILCAVIALGGISGCDSASSDDSSVNGEMTGFEAGSASQDGQQPGTDAPSDQDEDPAPGGDDTAAGQVTELACTAEGEVCLNVALPANYPGGAERLVIAFFDSFPVTRPPMALGLELENPGFTASSEVPITMSDVAAVGEVWILVVAYMPGGGTWSPEDGIDWVAESSTSIVLDGTPVNVSETLTLNLAGGAEAQPPTGEPTTGNGDADPESQETGSESGDQPDTNPGTESDLPSTGPVPTFTRVTLFDDLPGAAWLTPADLNGDGFDELLLTSLSEGTDFGSFPPIANGAAYILTRNGGPPSGTVGTWSAEKYFSRDDGFGFPNESTLYDIDNDGVMDWVIAGGFLAKPKGFIIWMKGQEGPNGLTFGSYNTLDIPDSDRWYHAVKPVDLDGDGDLDFITTNNNTTVQSFGGLNYGTSKLEWFENIGTPGVASFVPHDIGDVGGALFDLHDVDGDGDKDILLPQYFGGQSLLWVENPGDPNDLWVQHVINDTTGKGFGVEVADIDNDGQPEIVYGNHNHEASEEPEKQIMGVYYWDIPPVDQLDNLDNWDDTMHVIYEGFYIGSDKPDQDGAPGVVHTGDIDGDGDIDVTASGDGDDGVYLFVQQEVGVFDYLKLDAGLTMAGDHVMMDLDGDADMDIVWCVFGETGFSGITSHVYGYIQDGVTTIEAEETEPVKPDEVDTGDETPSGDSTETDTVDTDPSFQAPGPMPTLRSEVSENTSTIDAVSMVVYRPTIQGSFPVVVLMDGFNLAGDLYESYGDHLASWGFVVVIVDVVNNVVQSKTHVQLRDAFMSVIDWMTASNTSTNPIFAGSADLNMIVAAGHSAGGKAAVFAALDDPRVGGLFAIDPVDSTPDFAFGGVDATSYPSLTPERMGDLSVPSVFIGETTNATGSFGILPACAPADNNFQAYYEAVASAPVLEIDMIGADHFSFIDDPNCGFECSACPNGTANPAVVLTKTRAYLTAFMKAFGDGDLSAMDVLTGDRMNVDVSAGIAQIRTKNGF